MIPFNKPYIPKTNNQDQGIEDQAILNQLVKRGYEGQLILVNSATSALEIMALSMDIKHGDEIIMPSFTYAATANAFARAGAKIVFVDIEDHTLNIDPDEVEKALTSKTRAIIPIHYGGVSADMERLADLASNCGAFLLEDAAHGIGAFYKDKPLGTLGNMGCISFHPTKNISCGSGGVLIVNDSRHKTTTEEILHQGTNRLAFNRGKVSQYTWQRLGGEFSIHPYAKPVLNQSMKDLDLITEKRIADWHGYYDRLLDLEKRGVLKLPTVPDYAKINGHIFYVLVENRESLETFLLGKGIEAYSHYEPLHATGIGRTVGCAPGNMAKTNRNSRQVLRLPMFYDLKQEELEFVVDRLYDFFVR